MYTYKYTGIYNFLFVQWEESKYFKVDMFANEFLPGILGYYAYHISTRVTEVVLLFKTLIKQIKCYRN